MWKKYYPVINENSKLLIGMGDSFTQGRGACPWNIWEKYDWDLDKNRKSPHDNEIIGIEYENSWVNKICKNHLTNWTPLNLGISGCGNRSSASDLYLHPKLNIESASEKIVVMMLTSMNRFDFIDKRYSDHNHFFAMWPHPQNATTEMQDLWTAYHKHIWSDLFGMLETIITINNVNTWCKANNGKLIFLSAFDEMISKEAFYNIINATFNSAQSERADLVTVVDNLPWENYIKLDGFPTAVDYLMSLEGTSQKEVGWFMPWCKQFKGTPKGYMTPCGHPSVLGHDVLAEKIFNFLKEKRYV